MAIDFHVHTLQFKDRQEARLVDSYLVMASSLRSHRHRKGEILACLVDFNLPDLIEREDIERMLASAGKSFFDTPGSVTNAIQSAAAALNTDILQKNLSAETAETVSAAVNFAVYHKGTIFLAQSGITYTTIFSQGQIVHFFSTDLNERGLGTSRRFYLNYKQVPIQAGDLLILSTAKPETWNDERLQDSHVISLEQLHRRLMNQLSEDISALLLKCREGKGVVVEEVVDMRKTTPLADQPPAEKEIENVVTSSQAEIEKEANDKGATNSEQEFEEEYPEDVSFQTEPYLAGNEVLSNEIKIQVGETEKATRTNPPQKGPPEERAPTPKRPDRENPLQQAVTGIGQSIQRSGQNLFKKIGERFANQETSLEESTSSHLMSILVVVIPIALIVISVLVYIYSGRREQHQIFLDEAQSYITQAASIDDVEQQREYWVKAYDAVINAMDFGDSDLSNNLLTQTQTVLDDMDLVTRLDFRPATTSQFGADVILSHIKNNDSGLYLLDETSGSLFHAEKSSKGFYEIDSSFLCGPGTYGVITLGKIVDFTLLPTNTRGYELLAVDENGNLLYCQPGQEPVPGSLIPPENEWERIAAMSLDEYTLYVVDAESDRIWSYSGRDFEISAMAGIVFNSHPVDYLGTEEVDMGGALDIIVNKEDLFVLHQDSHMTTCQYNAYRAENATECQDPAPYGDSRIGYEKNPLVYFDSSFRVIQETLYPSSAFYILDNNNRAVLQFSYQLNLEKMLKPQPSRTYPLPETDMTGLGVTTEKEIFLAFGNQLYVSELP
ncbi:MAG TPA: hypothetical protein DCK95_05010 [Anaerolineaceae bacterium]|nr:hypothetical protein [Anaerolineaceae bacterium]